MTITEKRGDDRLPVIWEGQLTTADNQSYPCEVRDISLAGALISCSQEFNADEHLILEIDKLGDFAGVVRWRGSEQLGLLLLAGPDLMLKKFAEAAGAQVSREPTVPDA
ncbi:PilZ domain-containing protein [Kordiimonas sp. SCSIO 12610]|uniref:PilZ domain-containing protein n=1 Tax=Kordiimonas sp. SCSIO 12610 TaxID=2829597 RepID=UPI00210E178F|nr:PilZ domain-containing protein [Kordiimonas sp. SCSIO 12610]UTW55382.1 PilZ domain-containing protein [Kordiimonas sp. SCSIO 12610]